MDFYNRLNYSLGNEDWHVEAQALQVKPYDKVLCVTASGDRPLHLLMTECAEIHSIDMNAIQNFLLELKVAALGSLDFEEYLAFLGCVPSPFRLEIYKKIRLQLSSEARKYWDKNKKFIKNGVIYQGRVERITNFGARIIKLIRKKEINHLFAFTDIELQKNYIAKHWNTSWWNNVFNVLLNPNMMKWILNDPGMVSYIDKSIKPGNYIYQKMLNYLNKNLAKKSALIQLILTGKVLPEAYFPYLTYEGYIKIRSNLHKLKIETNDVIHYVTQTHHHFDCFSMSDIASYMSIANFEKLLQGIYHAAKPKARFCIRKLMSAHTIPTYLSHVFERNLSLEEKLEEEESNFVYRFIVGSINK